MEEWGFLTGRRHDLTQRSAIEFKFGLLAGRRIVSTLPDSISSRNDAQNFVSRSWSRWVKEECLSKLILFGECSLRRALLQYVAHYHEERNHQGKENLILFPNQTEARRKKEGAVRCRERLGGLLKYYEREAA